MSKRAGSASVGGGSVSALLSSDPRLLPRITSYLQNLPAGSSAVTPASITEHLRAKYPDYQRKSKEFNKHVERLCERMRAEAAAEAEAEEQQQATPKSAVGTEQAASADAQMSDVQRGAAEEVVILSSSMNGSPLAGQSPSATAAAFVAGISFAPTPISTTQQPTGAVPAAGASSAVGAANKRHKGADGGATPTASDGAGSQSSGEDSDSSDDSVVDMGELSVSGPQPPSGGGANSAMRNLYMKKAPVAAPDAATPDGAAQQQPRQRKSKDKVVYTQNSQKKSVKKRAAALRPGASAHFTNNNGGPDDAAAAGVGGGGGGGGDGSGWQPEVLHPTASYADLGGIEAILQEIRELIEYPLSHPEIYAHLGVQAPRGVLLHGPPGCGKTLLAHCIAGELGVPFLKISAPEVVSGMSGESEQKIRNFFAAALENAPCIMFIDEIDAITPKRATAQREMERRIVAQLLTCMDSLSTTHSGDPNKIVIVIGATNRPDSLDAALRRAGRFDREISLGIPDEAARARILSVMCRQMKVEGGLAAFDWGAIAKKAVGYVGADLMALTREAAVLAINRIFRTVLPTPVLRPQVTAHITGVAAPPALSLLMPGSSSPKLGPVGATNPPTGSTAPPSAAALALTASLTAAAAAAAANGGASSSSSALVPASTSPRLDGAAASPTTSQQQQQAHLIPDLKSTIAASELHSRSRASDKLRAHVEPLSEEQLAPLCISYADFHEALKKVQPSSKREGFATIPDVTWNDIGALDNLREELNMTILQPILNPLQFESIGLTVPAGVLLFGPPGCGKTLVAKAIANESGASFLSIKGPELLNQYVGQSERAVRKVFQRARASSPCVIFFDELDALVPKRGSGGEGSGSQVSERVVNQLLTEMDGLEERRFVFVIAATNRPDMIDPAMLRPGRLDKLLYVRLPSAQERAAILRKHLRRTPLSSDVDVNVVAADPRAEGFSGADIAALCREATLQALRDAQNKQRQELAAKGVHQQLPSWASMTHKAPAAPAAAAAGSAGAAGPVTASGASFNLPPLPVLVQPSHFDFAFSKVFPSVSQASRIKYDRMHKMLCRARSTLSNEAPGEQAALPPQQPTIKEEDEGEAGAETTAAPASASNSPALRHSPMMPPPPQPKKQPLLAATTLTTFAPAAAAASAPAATGAPHTGTILSHMTGATAAGATAAATQPNPNNSSMDLQ